MGASAFMHKIESYDVRTAFDALVQEAVAEYGDRSYNGTISTCSLGRCRVLSDVYSKRIEQQAMKIVEQEDYGRKWTATVLDLGVVGYDVITATKQTPDIKKKADYKTKYAVLYYPPTYPLQEKMIASYETKKEADKAALEFALLHRDNNYFVAKRPVNVNGGDDVISRIKVDVVRKKTKPSTLTGNKIVKPVHVYIFYGLASC